MNSPLSKDGDFVRPDRAQACARAALSARLFAAACSLAEAAVLLAGAAGHAASRAVSGGGESAAAAAAAAAAVAIALAAAAAATAARARSSSYNQVEFSHNNTIFSWQGSTAFTVADTKNARFGAEANGQAASAALAQSTLERKYTPSIRDSTEHAC
eukprot:6196912-Pleurochrysis_carterae.AAC.1